MQRANPRAIVATWALLISAAVLSWYLAFWLTVERPGRSRVISESARVVDVARSLSLQQGYIDRLITPVQVRLFHTGAPQPAAGWSPLYPAAVGIWFGVSGQRNPTAAIVLAALGYLVALTALYALSRIVLPGALAWIPPLVLALDPGMLRLATDALPDGWFMAFLALAFLLLAVPGRSGHHVAAAGLAMALAQLTCPSAVFFLGAFIFLASRPLRAALSSPLATGGAETKDTTPGDEVILESPDTRSADEEPHAEAGGDLDSGGIDASEFIGPDMLGPADEAPATIEPLESAPQPPAAGAELEPTPSAPAPPRPEPAPHPPMRGLSAIIVFLGLFVLTLLPWLLYRSEAFGSLFFDLGQYKVLHNLAPSDGLDVLRSVRTPEPGTFTLTHPLGLFFKAFLGLLKTPFLLVFSYFNPLELALIVVGTAVLLREGRGRRIVGVAVGLFLVQVALSVFTTLDMRTWRPITIFLWIPLAAGAGDLAQRLSPRRPRLGVALLVALVAIVPFGRDSLDAYLDPGLGNARFSEEEAQVLGAWASALVPPQEPLLTDFEELVWYADRAVLWRPVDPSEVEEVRVLGGVSYALWREGPGADAGAEEWRRLYDGQLKSAGMRRLGEIRLDSGTYVIATWQ